MIQLLLAAAVLAQAGPAAPACPPPTPCICVCQGGAAAPPAPRVPAAIPEAGGQSRWYGSPAVAIDAAAFALLAGGTASENASVLLAGGAVFALGAPFVHLANRHPSRALASLGIRTLAGGLATGAVLADVLSHPCDGEPSCQHTPSVGLALGAVALLGAAVVDDALLAREDVTARTTGAELGVGLVLGPNLALLSLGGRL